MSLSGFCKNIFLILIFLAVKQVSGFSQNLLTKEITLAFKTGSSVSLLSQIEETSGIAFSYSNKLCLKESVNLKSQTNTIKGFIEEIFSDCTYEIKEKKSKILIFPVDELSVPSKFVISGFVKNTTDNECLIGASVYDSKTWTGASSNNFGYYSITMDEGEIILNCSFVGFDTEQFRFDLQKDTIINFSLRKNALLSEVPVVSFYSQEGVTSSRTSTISVPVNQIKKIPSFLGEVDVARTLQLLPGINGGSEGVSGLYVRGGGSDQNLFLIDDVPVYNISHLFGFFSVFNEDAINNVTVTKGGFPARYGGRLSSVVDIRLKDGNTEKTHGSLSVGMMSSKLALDGPLFKDKTTYSISFRRSYYDLLAFPIQSGNQNKTSFYFYDSNAKISHKINDKNRLYLSFYGGRDRFYTKYNYLEIRNPNQPAGGTETINVNDENYSGWGNTITSFRWNKIYHEKLFSNLSLAYSNYTYSVGFEDHQVENEIWNYYEQKYYSGITDLMLKLDFDYFANAKHHLRFGTNYINHNFNPGVDIIRESMGIETVVDSTIGGEDIYGKELYGYIEDDFEIYNKLKINAGMHISLYHIKGKVYNSFQPRISLRYLVHPRVAVKAAYSKMTQYMHLLTSSSVSLPTDLWIPVTDKITPQHAKQYSIGGNWELRKGFDLSLMFYSKVYENLLAYDKDQLPDIYNNEWDENFIYGDGYAKGLELLLHKKTGKWSGWVGYTLSDSKQRFSELNDNQYYPTNNYRKHDFSFFGNYLFNERFDISATWLFGSGNSVTLPSQKYFSPKLPTDNSTEINSYNEYVGSINGYKMPAFHRLDVGMNWRKNNKFGERIWSFGLYNVYGRQNAFSLYFADENESESGKRDLVQISIFPFPLPYISYTLKF